MLINHKFKILIIVLLFAVVSINWFRNLEQMIVDPDELVWIVDAQYFQYRQHGEYERFRVIDDFYHMAWSDPQYRVLDQPQMGKYIIGWWLKLWTIEPWSSSTNKLAYRYFVTGTLPEGNPWQLQSVLGLEMSQTIIVSRYLHSLVSLVSLALITFITWLFTKNYWLSLLSFFLLTIHPVAQTYLRISAVDGYLYFFFISCLLLCSWLFEKLSYWQLKKNIYIGSLIGMMMGLAITTKLNGLLLLGLPILIAILKLYYLTRSKKSEQVIIKLLKKIILVLVVIYAACGLTIYIVEPELWFSPKVGILLLESRMWQQAKFANYFGQMSFVQTIGFLINNYLNVFSFKLAKLFLLIISILGFSQTLIKKKKTFFELIFLTSSIYLIIGNSYYARVGFDRYSLLTIFIFVIWAAIGINFGLKLIKSWLIKHEK